MESFFFEKPTVYIKTLLFGKYYIPSGTCTISYFTVAFSAYRIERKLYDIVFSFYFKKSDLYHENGKYLPISFRHKKLMVVRLLGKEHARKNKHEPHPSKKTKLFFQFNLTLLLIDSVLVMLIGRPSR